MTKLLLTTAFIALVLITVSCGSGEETPTSAPPTVPPPTAAAEPTVELPAATRVERRVPTRAPAATSTEEPTAPPTVVSPTAAASPTAVPPSATAQPTNSPTLQPTAVPPSATLQPTQAPTDQPTAVPPTEAPTEQPTAVPPTATAAPTSVPTIQPTTAPPTPTLAPAVYVTSLTVDPPQPKSKPAQFVFHVGFLSTVGETVNYPRWRVLILRKGEQHAFGDPQGESKSIATGVSTQSTTPFAINVFSTCEAFIAKPIWEDENAKQIPFPMPDGSAPSLEFQVCP